jgi:isoquinoline 1-oxidoreductase alpha subunit
MSNPVCNNKLPKSATSRDMPDTTSRASKAPPAPAVKPEDKTQELRINGRAYYPNTDPDMPLLWYLRDVLRLTGTKFGCGVGACGACTVLIDGKAQRACLTPLKAAMDHDVTTIEGLAATELHPLQRAWIEEDVAQCGYCQTGQIMAAADLLKRNTNPGDDDIAKIPNLCRCGTYPRIRRAIKRAAQLAREGVK